MQKYFCVVYFRRFVIQRGARESVGNFEIFSAHFLLVNLTIWIFLNDSVKRLSREIESRWQDEEREGKIASARKLAEIRTRLGKFFPRFASRWTRLAKREKLRKRIRTNAKEKWLATWNRPRTGRDFLRWKSTAAEDRFLLKFRVTVYRLHDPLSRIHGENYKHTARPWHCSHIEIARVSCLRNVKVHYTVEISCTCKSINIPTLMCLRIPYEHLENLLPCSILYRRYFWTISSDIMYK